MASINNSGGWVGGAVGLLLCIRHARDLGEGLSADDTGALACAIDTSMAKRVSLEEGLGLGGGWQAALARHIADLVRPNVDPGRVAGEARDLRQRLLRYVEQGHFDADLVKQPGPGSERRRHYDLMVQFRGRVPEDRTLRDWLTI